MKKISLILIILSIGLLAYSQLSGSGTILSPYTGSITSSTSWDNNSHSNDTVYVGGVITIGSGGHLTIDPTLDQTFTIAFTSSSAGFDITSGQLTADGTSTDSIRFSCEGASNWGHIYFSDPTNTNSSIFVYCLLENGSVSGSGYSGAGGAVIIRNSSVSFTNCLFRDNVAEWGGAVFVDAGRNPSFTRCTFINNEATNGGGGAIYFWNNSSSVIQNCIFYSNKCTEVETSTYTGGAIEGQTGVTIKIVNSTFVNNTSTQPGDALALHSSPSARVINCIFWGSNDQISLATTTQIVNCAIQESSGYTNTIYLNVSNSASNGPNFNATDGTDWSIKFISPCRDTGTDTYSGVSIPSTDYINNNRIGTTDIGAYEVQYSRWTGATSNLWGTLSNWDKNLRPTSNTSDVIIPTGMPNYPTGSPDEDFNIGSGKYLFVEPGARLTLDQLGNSGSLTLKSNASAIFSLILAGYSGAGTATIQLFLKGGTSPDNMWHYIAVPHDMDKSVLTAIEPYNLLRFDDSRITTSTYEGWQWHDGWDGSQTQPGDSWTTLEYKRGYDFYHATDVTIEYDASAIYSGLGTITLNNYEDDVDPNSLWGLNLIGNSLTCTIDWEEVSFSNADSVRNAIYITKENSIASYINGVGTNGGTQYIPPLQGFFVRTLNDGEHIDFSGAKTHSGQARFKGMVTIPLIRLEISNESGNRDETVVRFDYNATEEFDSRFDASKILSQSLIYPQIYSIIGNEKYSINGLPFPDDQYELTVPVKITSPGIHSISATQIQGIENYKAYLIDKYENNYTINLNEISEYSFSSVTGTFDDRFILKVTTATTGLDDRIKTDHEFNMYSYSNLLNIQTLADEWSGVRAEINMYDLTGRIIGKYPDVEFYAGETKQLPFNQPKGIYIVEITEGGRRVVRKVSHR